MAGKRLNFGKFSKTAGQTFENYVMTALNNIERWSHDVMTSNSFYLQDPNSRQLVDLWSIDAFNRLRVSSPVELFSAQCQYNADPLLLQVGATGAQGQTPVWASGTRMINLQVTSGVAASTSWVQSYDYLPYQAGRSQLALMTGVVGAAVSGAQVDWGYFDASNGVMFRQTTAGGLAFVLRTSTSGSPSDANIAAQADWNLDRLDGTGPGHHTLDVTKSQILVFDLQYLAMGRVRCGFDINGSVFWAHEFLNANASMAVPYMQTATLPVQMLITVPTSIGSTKNSFFKCAAVITEGGAGIDTPESYTFSSPNITLTAGNATRTHGISIRPQTTFNSLGNRSRFRLKNISMSAGGNPVFWELCVGQALTAPTYRAFGLTPAGGASYTTTYSGFEYTSAATLSGAPAIVIAGGLVDTSTQVTIQPQHNYPITLDRAGAVRDLGTLTLLLTGVTGASATYISTTHEEIR